MEEKKTKSILIIEDEAIMRESLRAWLAEDGYQVEAAKDGEEGSKAIAERNFDVVLLDLKLPGKDGIEVLREARALRPQLKAIIITAYPSVQTAVQAMKEGAVDYLSKPLDLNDLEELIAGTLKLVPKDIRAKLATGEAIPTLRVEAKAEGLNISLAGWEYIDDYLFPKKEG